MASRSPSGARDPNGDMRSFLSGPGLRILLGIGAGYVARRLWTHPQDSLDSKLAQLRDAPTIPMSDLKGHMFTREGQLVLIRNSVVLPLSSIPDAECESKGRLLTTRGQEAVVKRTVVYTEVKPKELEGDYARTRKAFVSRVPFALVPNTVLFRKRRFVIVRNAEVDQLPLCHGRAMRTEVEHPCVGSVGGECRNRIKAYKVARESVLEAETRLDNVFGWVRRKDGFLEIEPCSTFPKKCFTMSRREIKKEIQAQATDANVYPIRTCSVGFGLVSLGLLLSGLCSYGMN